jgi:hypothetical protein
LQTNARLLILAFHPKQVLAFNRWALSHFVRAETFEKLAKVSVEERKLTTIIIVQDSG